MTGAQCVSSYRCDANRDKKFDEKDTLQGKKLFCLTSPCGFSGGNLVPCMYKESNVVTLLGRPSAGIFLFVLDKKSSSNYRRN